MISRPHSCEKKMICASIGRSIHFTSLDTVMIVSRLVFLRTVVRAGRAVREIGNFISVLNNAFVSAQGSANDGTYHCPDVQKGPYRSR